MTLKVYAKEKYGRRKLWTDCDVIYPSITYGMTV